MEERLQKIIGQAGIASRRKAEELILAGKVKINGVVVTDLGKKYDRTKVKISVEGKLLKNYEPKLYFLLNKPKGYISTVRDERGRKTVIELLPEVTERIYPVGRLDADTEGLIVLTNDGELMNALLHPSREVPKTYSARIEPGITNRNLKALSEGVLLEDGPTAPALVNLVYQSKEFSRVELTIHEGRNRQVRRMFAALGYEVRALKRICMGNLVLTGLKRGEHRPLTEKEIRGLYNLAGLEFAGRKRDGETKNHRGGRRRGGNDGGDYGRPKWGAGDFTGKNAATGTKNAHHRKGALQFNQRRRHSRDHS